MLFQYQTSTIGHVSSVEYRYQDNQYIRQHTSGMISITRKPVEEIILSEHRLNENELRRLIQFCYLDGLKVYWKTLFLFRYRHQDIDEDIWSKLNITDEERDMVDILVYDLAKIVETQYEYITECLLSNKPSRATVIHITDIEILEHVVLFKYVWE